MFKDFSVFGLENSQDDLNNIIFFITMQHKSNFNVQQFQDYSKYIA